MTISSMRERFDPIMRDPSYTVSSSEFNAVIEARQTARIGMAQVAIERQTKPENTNNEDDQPRNIPLLIKAIQTYREFMTRTENPNTPRQILVMENAGKRPFDGVVLYQELAKDLATQKLGAEKIDTEIALWESLYGTKKSDAILKNPERTTALIRELDLGFLEEQVIADFYRAAGNDIQAEKHQKIFDSQAIRYAARVVLVNAGAVLIFLTGFVVLMIAVNALLQKNWRNLGFRQGQNPTNTRPQDIGYGTLADVFIAYLTLTELLRLIADFLTPKDLPDVSIITVTLIAAATYISPAILGMFYLHSVLKRQGVSWSAIGWQIDARWGRDILYGILAWTASLPLTALLGALSRLIFRNDATTEPNPILPLVTAETDPMGQLLIFALAAIAAPVVEEIFFRGALLTAFRTKWNWVVSVLLSAVLFAVVHPIQDWLPIFALGCSLGIVRVIRGNLLPCIVMHMLQNGMTFLVLSNIFAG
jgi:membrane protease YdiL (CAAX protease family)